MTFHVIVMNISTSSLTRNGTDNCREESVRDSQSIRSEHHFFSGHFPCTIQNMLQRESDDFIRRRRRLSCQYTNLKASCDRIWISSVSWADALVVSFGSGAPSSSHVRTHCLSWPSLLNTCSSTPPRAISLINVDVFTLSAVSLWPS